MLFASPSGFRAALSSALGCAPSHSTSRKETYSPGNRASSYLHLRHTLGKAHFSNPAHHLSSAVVSQVLPTAKAWECYLYSSTQCNLTALLLTLKLSQLSSFKTHHSFNLPDRKEREHRPFTAAETSSPGGLTSKTSGEAEELYLP